MNLTKSKTAKLVAGFVGLVMALSFALPVSAATAEELQAQINSLLATIQALQSQLSATTGGTTTTTAGYQFNTNLTVGSKGVDVLNLQKVLNMSADTKVASTGAGSPGMETSTFGPATKAAVIKFQIKNGITPAAGYVGAITRAKLNSMGGTTTGGTTTGGTTLPTGGALTVTAATQPANSLAPYGASRIPFTKVTLTAGSSDVTVNSLTVQRSGLGVDANFQGVVLLDDQGMQIGIAKTLNSNHQALVGEPFVIKAGTSKTLTIAGNMAAANVVQAGQVVGLDVVAVNTTATVAGSLPVTGAMHTINANLAIGSVSVSTSSFDPNSAGSQPIGTTAYRFTGFRLTAGSGEDLTFKSIRWNQSGSAGSSDIANVVTVVNGTSYPTTVSADGKYFSTVFPSGIVIAKGNSVDVYVQGDIVGSGAAGRVVEFDVYKNTDVYLMGNTYGYGVTAPNGTVNNVSSAATHATNLNNSANPWLQGSTLSVTAGSVTLIGKANEVASQNIAPAVQNQVLGGFATNFSGEPVSVQSMTFTVSTSSSIGGAITNVTLVDASGAVVAGPVDTGYTSGATQTITFSDTVTFPVGRAVYTLKGKIASGAVNGATITVATTPSSWTNVTGQTTGNSVTISTGAFNMNQMTVKGAALAVNVLAQPAAQYIVAGVQELELARYQLDATQSGEDIRLSSMPVIITGTAADLTGCQLYNGTTALNTGSRVVNTFTSGTARNYSFDSSLMITKGTSVTLSLKCNLGSSASGTYQVSRDATEGDWSVTGVTSGNSVTNALGTLTWGTGNGGLMTVANGSIALSVDTSSPNYAVVAGGTTGVTVGVLKLRASNEDVNLTKVGFVLSTSTSADLGTVSLYQGSTLLGTVNFPQGAGATATSTLISPLKLTKDTDVLLTVKADIAAIGSGQSGTQGRLVQINPLNAEGYGIASGGTLKTGSSGSVAGVRMFKSYPTVVLDTLSSSGVADGKFMRFKITANSAGAVGIYRLTFTLATSSFVSGGGVSAIGLYAYSDAGYSSPVSTVAGSGQFDTGNKTPSSNPATLTYSAQTNPLQIPAGQTYYFELRGSVAGTQTGTSVTTSLLGDSAYITGAHLGVDFVSTTTGAIADGARFIWSGNATSTAVFDANDWANGYSIQSLPSGGLSQTRSN